GAGGRPARRPAAVPDAGGRERRDRVPRRQRPDGHRGQPHPAGDPVGARRLRRAARRGRDPREVTSARPTAQPVRASTAVSARAVVRRPARVRVGWLLLVLVVVALTVVASVLVGSRAVTWDEISAALGGSTDGLGAAAVTTRLSRTTMALLVGAALGLSGAVMQCVTRNPLADPGIPRFGLWTYSGYIWAAIIGAAITAVFVYIVGSLGRGGATPLTLVLAGAATSAAASSFISAVVLPRGDIAGGVRSWQIGGVGGASPEAIDQVLPFLVVGALICVLAARPLNSLALGDDLAAGLGERVLLTRAVSPLGAVLLCG